MKFNIKAIAAAVALVATGAAHADLTSAANGNSSFALVAFNTTTHAYFVRDLGTNLNSFLPNNITTGSGDGGVTGNKTPEAGLNVTWAGDQSWTDWLSAQTASAVKWTVTAGDSAGTSGTSNVQRVLVAESQASTSNPNPSNTTVRTGATNVTALANLVNGTFSGTSATGTFSAAVQAAYESNNNFGAETLGSLGVSSSLYYIAATAGTLANSALVTLRGYANSLNTATLTLASNGTLTYDLQPAVTSAVPLPDSIWMMGVGLLAVGGMVRRRKAAAQA